ncbi:unnamed protein product [Amoebophrya sp. A25]|nr:unnamed protein product [Amoebophrya sp. A25]|eukprot:GSA25T00005324001.1
MIETDHCLLSPEFRSHSQQEFFDVNRRSTRRVRVCCTSTTFSFSRH